MKRFYFFLFCLLPVIVFPAYSASSDYRFRSIDVSNGLTNNEIRHIYKDSSGFIWIGTPSGLNRYDGNEVVAIRQPFTGDQNNFSNNDIWQIQESFDRKLWLQTAYSFAIYDLKEERFEANPTALFEKYCGVSDFSKLFIDKNKNFWFILWDDVRYYNVETGEKKIFPQGKQGGLSNGLIIDMKQSDDYYWFLFDNGLVECMDIKTHQVVERNEGFRNILNRPNQTNMRLFVDAQNDVWIYNIGTDYGIACLQAHNNKWQRFSSHTPGFYISQNIVMSMGEDKQGRIWVGTDHGGISLIDKKTGKTEVIRHDETIPLSLPENTVNCIFRDDMGTMWVGTYKKGACYYNEELFKFRSVTAKSGLSYADINCFEEDRLGNIWMGTNGGGLICYDRKSETFMTYKHNPANANSPAGDVIVSMETDNAGRLWIGYYLSGLDCYDGKNFTHYGLQKNGEEFLPDENIWQLCIDSNNRLWIGTLRGGILVIDPDTKEKLQHFVTEGSVYSIIERNTGEILVGMQRGIYTYNAAAGRLVAFEKDILGEAQLNRYDINVLLEDKRGLLWIGTRNGLFVLDQSSRKLRFFDTSDGLASDLTQGLLEDEDNNIWQATNNGLTYIRVSRDETNNGTYDFHISHYDTSDGLQGEQFNYDSGFRTSNNELIFGGVNGFNLFRPLKTNKHSGNPPLVFTELQIYNERIAPCEEYKGRVVLEQSIAETKEITLNHSDNFFSISFAALDYLHADKAHYSYKLEGFNSQWMEADRNSRKVTYTNLDPGNYTLYLKVYNEIQEEEPVPVTLKIKILPPFWRTHWAWLFYLLAGAGMITVYTRWLIRKR